MHEVKITKEKKNLKKVYPKTFPRKDAKNDELSCLWFRPFLSAFVQYIQTSPNLPTYKPTPTLPLFSNARIHFKNGSRRIYYSKIPRKLLPNFSPNVHSNRYDGKKAKKS